ncbi:uncharacterized protein N7511_002295 [Penicillium nucicola]|uniref:uncharacterized protein n=1 Tax=Penicillium nucicola TaxID=1850975 RepID=UPI002544FCDD|nr:uncharacterized protein N7511_002295 [Penicillium nucicola]KAJ5770244.1 hypothetical protein N7511_002295 [Penicillium nucicola]
MAFDPSYPEDFKRALTNTISDKDMDQFVKHGGSPRFVYGALMLPTVLKYYIDREQNVKIHKQMTQATLHGYQLYDFADDGVPVIVRSHQPHANVKGMLIFNLSNEERNSIYEFEGGLMQLSSVQVDTIQKSCLGVYEMRKIDAGAFVWHESAHLLSPRIGLKVIHASSWDLVPFLEGIFYRDIKASQRRGAREKEVMGIKSQAESSGWDQANRIDPGYRDAKMITSTSSNELIDDDDDDDDFSSPKTEIFMYPLDEHEARLNH